MPGAGLEPARPEGRGILSPLRLPIPPPGRPAQCSLAHRVPQRGYTGECGECSRSFAALKTLRFLFAWGTRSHGIRTHAVPVPPPHLLHATTHLLLQRRVPRALERRHELREILLLLLDKIDPLML